MVSEPGPSVLLGRKHNDAPAPPPIGGGRSAISFRERSARRRQTRSAAARPQDAAVYGRRSRPPAGTLMNLSMRPPLRATASPGTPRPNPPSNTSSAPTTRNVQVVYFWQAGPGSFWIALQRTSCRPYLPQQRRQPLRLRCLGQLDAHTARQLDDHRRIRHRQGLRLADRPRHFHK